MFTRITTWTGFHACEPCPWWAAMQMASRTKSEACRRNWSPPWNWCPTCRASWPSSKSRLVWTWGNYFSVCHLTGGGGAGKEMRLWKMRTPDNALGLFAARWPLNAELSKCKTQWVIVHCTVCEAFNLLLLSSFINSLSLVTLDFITDLPVIRLFINLS